MSNDYDLLENAHRQDVQFYAENGRVFMDFCGDGLYLFDVKSNRKNTFAEQICDILNSLKEPQSSRDSLP